MMSLRDALVCAMLIVFAVECAPREKRDALICGHNAHWNMTLNTCVCDEGCGGSLETGCIPPPNQVSSSEENNEDDRSSSEGDNSNSSDGDNSNTSEGDSSNSSDSDSSNSSDSDSSNSSEDDSSNSNEGDSNNSSEGDGSNSSKGDGSTEGGKETKCGIRAYRVGKKCVCYPGCRGDPYVKCVD
ncbi:uncharacterized protein LOC110466046 [Mizuhopecten yessoensis]|uniref:uncharacterized protein LOC110466046 n=1 Tax=Mizuhopecten yessoensis TaxID=6573 RepID=UPI000B45BA47|nr:uncharacterized protein LOC110466046 [Mizuhopecten yessoensis]